MKQTNQLSPFNSNKSSKIINPVNILSLFAMLTFCFSPTVNAQVSTFLEKGKSAISLRGGVSSVNNFMVTGSLGGSLKGKYDFEMTSNYGTIFSGYKEFYGKQSSQLYISGVATWWFLRKQIIPEIEINLGLKGGYENCTYNQFSYTYQDSIRIDDKNYWAAKIGFSSSVNIKLSEKWYFQPFYTIYFDCGEGEYYLNNDLIQYLDYGESSFLGFSLFHRNNRGNVFHVIFNENMSSHSSLTNYSIVVGYAIVL